MSKTSLRLPLCTVSSQVTDIFNFSMQCAGTVILPKRIILHKNEKLNYADGSLVASVGWHQKNMALLLFSGFNSLQECAALFKMRMVFSVMFNNSDDLKLTKQHVRNLLQMLTVLERTLWHRSSFCWPFYQQSVVWRRNFVGVSLSDTHGPNVYFFVGSTQYSVLLPLYFYFTTVETSSQDKEQNKTQFLALKIPKTVFSPSLKQQYK